MGFTLLMIGVPIIIVTITMNDPVLKPIAMFGAAWFWLSVPIVTLYWLTRVIRRAWRDGTTRTAS